MDNAQRPHQVSVLRSLGPLLTSDLACSPSPWCYLPVCPALQPFSTFGHLCDHEATLDSGSVRSTHCHWTESFLKWDRLPPSEPPLPLPNSRACNKCQVQTCGTDVPGGYRQTGGQSWLLSPDALFILCQVRTLFLKLSLRDLNLELLSARSYPARNGFEM